MPQQYPLTLLPKENYKYIECNVETQFLIRYVDRDSEEESIIDPTGKILVEHIGTPRERVQDLSVSLLGVYKKEHTELKFTDAGKANFAIECLPNTVVDCPTHTEDFIFDKKRTFWGIQIDKIVGKKVNINVDDKDKEAICYVQHTPTKGNFWHYSVRWTVDGKPISELEKKVELKIAKKIGANARAIFIQFAKDESEVENCDGLNTDCYCIA